MSFPRGGPLQYGSVSHTCVCVCVRARVYE